MMSAEVSGEWRVAPSTAIHQEMLRRSPAHSSLSVSEDKDPDEGGKLFSGSGVTSPRSGRSDLNTNVIDQSYCGDGDSDSDISVGGCPSYTPIHTPPGGRHSSPSSPATSVRLPRTPPSPHSDDEYFKPLKKLRMMQLQKQEEQQKQSNSLNNLQPNEPGVSVPQVSPHNVLHARQSPHQVGGVKSFSIHDILNHQPPTQNQPNHQQSIHIALATRRIVRPWDTDEDEEEEDDSMSVCSSSESSSVVGSPRPASEGSAASTARRKEGNPLDALFQMTSKTFSSIKNGTGAGKLINNLLYK